LCVFAGLFVYSCGCVVVVEDLHTGSQRQWFGHTEEISTLAVTHDAQVPHRLQMYKSHTLPLFPPVADALLMIVSKH